MNAVDFDGFESAGREVLNYLQQHFGFDLWMITRAEGKDWIVLQATNNNYGVVAGQVYCWADSFCSEMVKGNGPHIAPDVEQVPLYAVAPLKQQMDIQAYIGQPLTYEDGRLFGTLCALNPIPQPKNIIEDALLLQLMATLLSTVLQAELKNNEQIRRNERLEAEVLTDELTNLYNRRGWNRLLVAEEERCRRHGHPAAVLVIDLNNLKFVNDTYGHDAGDQLIKLAANALNSAARSNDVVARLGGDEFGVLCVECDERGAEQLIKRINELFAQEDLKGAIGLAIRQPPSGLQQAWLDADKRMYSHKRISQQTDND